MRYLVALIASVFGTVAFAQDWEDQKTFGDPASDQMITVLSSTDTSVFAPIIEAFISGNPSISVKYFVTNTADIDRRFRQSPDAYDVVVSSAMDLQLKLANDGYALTLNGLSHPDWAQWRQSLFGFTSEPAAIVINRAAFAGSQTPKTRQELIEALRADPEAFRGRVGTYDVRVSGLGYLFATQDARASETYWRLMEVMGGLEARLYCCSGAMIDDLINGEIAVAYNVLGSYASARADAQVKLEVIFPSDFPTTMMRTAMVSAEADKPEEAQAFISHLIGLRPSDASNANFLPTLIRNPTDTDRTVIALEPALLTFLDALKRRRFLAEWENAVIQ